MHPVTPDVDRASTFPARFLDRAGRCAGAFGLGEVGFECCQAGWRAGIRPRLKRIEGRAVAGARPAGISRVVRRCRGSRRVGGACRCRAGCRKPLRCGGGGSSGTRTRRGSGRCETGYGRSRAIGLVRFRPIPNDASGLATILPCSSVLTTDLSLMEITPGVFSAVRCDATMGVS